VDEDEEDDDDDYYYYQSLVNDAYQPLNDCLWHWLTHAYHDVI